ncbi:MAG: type IX secretion system protein PorQ [Bacteroidetes bacterium]|nr:type IX secretion system protein PorQ [Bacteroidota bacterium]
MRLYGNVLLWMFTVSAAFGGDLPAYNFLRNDVSARASAMGGSFVSMTNDPNLLFYNPAGLATITNQQISLGYTKFLLDIHLGSLAYANELSDIGMLGIGVNYVNYGSFDGRNDLGIETGTFNAGDAAFSLSLARTYEENLYYGITAKIIHSSIEQYSSSALGFDFGILYSIPGDNPITLGAALTNAGTQLSAFDTQKESLPLELRIGGTIKPQHLPLLLNLNFTKLTEAQSNFINHFSSFTLGGEFTASKTLRFRFGYSNEKRKELKIGTSAGLTGFSFGGGLVLNSIRIDYAFNSLGKIGSLNRITVGIDI